MTKKQHYMGTPVHLKIGGKKYWNIAWYPKKRDAEDRAAGIRKKGLSVRILKRSPWGYPDIKAYLVYVPDHTKI